MDELYAHQDEDGPHRDGAEHPVEQHPVLVLRWDGEVRERQNEDEDVVDTERLLDQVGGDEFDPRLVAPPQEHQPRKQQRERDIECAEKQRLPQPNHMVLAVQDT